MQCKKTEKLQIVKNLTESEEVENTEIRKYTKEKKIITIK